MTEVLAARTERVRSAAVARPVAVGAPALLAAVAVGALAADNGGYFPQSWSWTSLVAAWAIAVALIIGAQRFTRLEAAFTSALGLLLAWTGVSLVWTTSASHTWDEIQRTLAYSLVVVAALLTIRRRTVATLELSLWAAIAIVSLYSLATRIFPNWLAVKSGFGGLRLSSPIGYWNGLGSFAALGVLLGLGAAARSKWLAVRMLGAASLPVLVATLYFTYSRGAWLALGIGLLAAVAIDARPLQLIAHAVLLAVPVGLTVLVAYRSSALTHLNSTVAAATHDGHRLAIVVAIACIAAAWIEAIAAHVEARWSVPRGLRRAYAILVAGAAVAAIALVILEFGSPSSIAQRGWHAFDRPPPATGTNLNNRLFQFSGSNRGGMWRVAWHDGTHHLLTGSGAGSYEATWLRNRPSQRNTAKDAHNLYAETFAELGVVGVGLLVCALAIPLIAVLRARRDPLVPLTAGAYVTFLAHAAVDWDWELPAVTMAALLCGVAILVAARRRQEQQRGPRVPLRCVGVAAAVAIAAFAFVGVVGNTAVSRARAAADRGDWSASAAQARKATHWLPWSADAWRLLGEAQLARGAPQAAASFRRAVAKDRNDWENWFDLALATKGAAHREALARARYLNPRDPIFKELHR